MTGTAHGTAGPAETRGPDRRGTLLDRALGVLAGLAAALMMTLTFFDVVGRYFFNRPIHGAFEMTEILMALIVFCGLPLATARRDNISVTVAVASLPHRVRAVLSIVADVAGAAVSALLAWRIGAYGLRLLDRGEVTLELGVPRGYVALALATLAAVTAVAFLANAWRVWRTGRHLID